MFVSREGDGSALEASRLLIERELNRLTQEAEQAVAYHTPSITTHDGKTSPTA